MYSKKLKQTGKGSIYKLLDWVVQNKDKLNWYEICKQPFALDIIDDYEQYIDIAGLAANKDPKAFDMILKYEHKIKWNNDKNLKQFLENIADMNNEKAIKWLLIKYQQKVLSTRHFMLADNFRFIILENLFANYHSLDLLAYLLPKIYNEMTDLQIRNIDIEILMIENTNPQVFDMLEKFLRNKRVNKKKQDIWKHMSLCPSAVPYLRNHPKKINWEDFCENYSPDAIDFIEESLQKKLVKWSQLDIDKLCSNKYAFNLIKKYISEYGWDDISLTSICKSMGMKALDLIVEDLKADKLSWYNIIKSDLHILLDNEILSPEIKSGVLQIVNKITKIYSTIDWTKIKNSSMLSLILYQIILRSKDYMAILESEVVEFDTIFLKTKYKAILNNVSAKKDDEYYVKDIFDWTRLATDSSTKAVEIMTHYPQYLKQYNICRNTNPNVINIIENNPTLYHPCLCTNQNALQLLFENQQVIDWGLVSQNKGIFELDREKMTNKMRTISRQSGLLDDISIVADSRKYRPRYIENFVDEIESLNTKQFGDTRHLLNRQNFAKKTQQTYLTNKSLSSVRSLPTYSKSKSSLRRRTYNTV
jgi:hypothetical protein